MVGISGSLCSCLLPESLQVTTVKQIPEYHHESGEYFQLDIRVCTVSLIVIPLTFGTYCTNFLVDCVQKKMVLKLYQSQRLVIRQKLMMIKKSVCCHHWLQCHRCQEVEMWPLLKRLTSKIRIPFFLEKRKESLSWRGLLGPSFFCMSLYCWWLTRKDSSCSCFQNQSCLNCIHCLYARVLFWFALILSFVLGIISTTFCTSIFWNCGVWS